MAGPLAPRAQSMEERIELAVAFVALAVLVVGCFLVLRPFLSALLWGAILAFAAWPLNAWLVARMRWRRTGAALACTLMLAVAFVLPLVIVGSSLADAAARAIDIIRNLLVMGLPAPPVWLASIPVVGSWLYDSWREASFNSGGLAALIQPYLASIRDLAVSGSLVIGGGALEITLSVFAAFFFFRDGESAVRKAQLIGQRIFGDRTQHLIEVAGSTVRSVVYGFVGTAFLQGALSTIGYWIVGIQGALALGFLTFVLALLPPLGPPLIWGPIAIWLLTQDQIGLAIFMGLWGAIVVSGSDNFVRPWLISFGTKLSFLIIFLGVLGGALAFGFLGIFLGPTLLAVGYAIIQDWTQGMERRVVQDPTPRSAAAATPSKPRFDEGSGAQ